MSKKKYGERTIEVHAGEGSGDPTTGARATPIYLTSSYSFEDTETAQQLYALEKEGHLYTRISNPTTEVLEKRVAAIENGVGALAQSTGMSAILLAILNIAGNGDEIVSSNNLYGGTYTLFKNTMPNWGIKVNFVDTHDLEGYERAINENTKAIYTESIGNPQLDIPDFEKLAEIAHNHNIPLIVDNTCAITMVKPIDHGADIVVHSATKFLSGTGTTMGGIIVDGGNFNWANGKFPQFTEPDESYHGLIYSEAFGEKAFIMKARAHLMKDLGTVLSPINAFMILQSTESLSLRVNQHCENALEVAKFLKNHPAVEWVNYPGLEDNENHEMAEKYLNGKYGCIVGFGIKGGLEEGKKFIESVELLSHVANIADAKTLVIHPASTTHSNMTSEEQIESGITPDFIRLSVGIENAEDIIDDMDQALNKAIKDS
ncbi:O-acetylhomoserine aminocarboxypropyltransferase/cysteine synthase family protein [uncultured Methanobrevibacter sp.]|uniref:O-acetylhomoserine aminocarboxypropyltransferase/cysteine synthase family protein n=1 Tax=uncultured Methanobrevibacter sp. TaxID=253161 RepID=UPI0026E0079A|nr:O-acetylhomoserine aminocarboxypropyltransferase/cysteine synthase family protein [uncultured Methanobrevibacter sp.]